MIPSGSCIITVFAVEGQEDVGLISNYLNEINKEYDFAFFGYGTGSSSRIENILKLCRDLKIPKVAALFDRNPSTSDRDYVQCARGFPEYKIECLRAEDIRDKYVGNEVAKQGAFQFNPNNEKCTLKSDELGQDFVDKIKAI